MARLLGAILWNHRLLAWVSVFSIGGAILKGGTCFRQKGWLRYLLPLFLVMFTITGCGAQQSTMESANLIFPDGYRPGGWVANQSQLMVLSWPDYFSDEKSLTPYFLSLDNTHVTKASLEGWDLSQLFNQCMRISPDGTSMLTVRNDYNNRSNGGVYVADNYGHSQRFLIISGVIWDCPAWSFDGKKIAAVIGDVNDRTTLHISDKTGENQKDLLLSQEPYISGLAWSPDGSQIAFSNGVSFGGETISIINVSDGQLSRLVEKPDELLKRVDFPTWSPDGRYLAYIEGDPSGYGDVVVVKKDGTDKRYLRKIVDIHSPSDTDYRYGYLMWSPAGDYIAASRILIKADITEVNYEVELLPVPSELR